MVGFVARWLCWGLLLSVLGSISGCDTALPNLSGLEGPAGNEGNPAGVDQTHVWGGGEAPGECGSRIVGSVPGAAFIEMDVSWELDAQPADSPLVKTLLGGIACWTHFDTQGIKLLYETDAQGTIVAVHTLFDINGRKYYTTSSPVVIDSLVVRDGCLAWEFDMPDVPDPQAPEDFDPSQFPEGPCGLGRVAVGHDGQVTREPEGEYICLEYTSSSTCRDCWMEDGVWHAESSSSASWVARGSIDDVSVSTWATLCDEPDQAVNIRDGDSVNYSLTGRTTYRVSPSPEELGYQRL